MKSLLDAPARNDIIRRLNALRPDSARRWGKMNAHQMLCHCIDGLKVTFGEKGDVTAPKGFLASAFGRWLVIDSPIPWPKGSPSHPLFFEMQPGQFEQDRQQLLVYVDRFAKGPEQKWGTSPAFGDLSPAQNSRLQYRHFDHHLRQFGV